MIPCALLQLAVEYGDRVRFLKIDTDEEHELATQMEVCHLFQCCPALPPVSVVLWAKYKGCTFLVGECCDGVAHVTKIGFVYVLCRFINCLPWFLWAKIQRKMPYALKDYFLDKSFGTSLTRNYSFFILVLNWRSERGLLLDLCQLCMYFSSPNVLPLP